jgi:hypothetical protein
MKKYFLIPQPPLSKFFTFLVDDINENKNFGTTTDIDKIDYNRQLLGEEFNTNFKVSLLMTDKGGTGVFPIGKFITVIAIRDDEKKGSMTFMDYNISLPKEELREMLLSTFSENVTNRWLLIQESMRKDFTNEDDNVILLKPDETNS